MTDEQARELERRWGEPGPCPSEGWRCCYRCGEWYPPESRYWCMPHRICRACKADEKRGIWPITRQWHQKNRWGPDGRLVRRCCVCREWKPLTSYYLINKTDKPRSAPSYAYAACTPCAIRRKGYLSLPEMRRRMKNR